MPNAFLLKEHEPRLNNVKWDEYYIDRVLKDKVVKTGDGDDDYSIVKVVVEDKRSIKETIESQADDVGLENILRRYALTGDESILPQSVNANGGEVIDMTQLPQDLIEADNYYKNMKAQFDALPEALKQGRDFNAFMQSITQAQFDAYIASLQPKEDKQEKVEGGNK